MRRVVDWLVAGCDAAAAGNEDGCDDVTDGS